MQVAGFMANHYAAWLKPGEAPVCAPAPAPQRDTFQPSEPAPSVLPRPSVAPQPLPAPTPTPYQTMTFRVEDPARRIMAEHAQELREQQAAQPSWRDMQEPMPSVYTAPPQTGLSALGYSPEHESQMLTPIEPIRYRPPQWGSRGKWRHHGGGGPRWGGGWGGGGGWGRGWGRPNC